MLELERYAEVAVSNGVTIDTLKINSKVSSKPEIDLSNTAVIKTLDARSDVKVTGNGTVNNVKESSGAKVELGSNIKHEPDDTKPVTGITLDRSALELSAGGANGSLTATITPADATNKNVTWRTSDADVATVNNGTVTPVKPGTATITAETEDGNITAACAVTVKPTVTIDTENIKVAQGGTSQFQFTAIPAENILTGTRISIAVRKDGTTSPIGEIPKTTWVGNTVTLEAKPDAATGIYHLTITAEMNGQEGSATTTFEVTGPGTAAPESVTLKHNNADIPADGIKLAAGSTTTLAATVNPSNASQGVIWSVEAGGDAFVSVDQYGEITAKAAGTATVIATSAADRTKSAKCKVTVTNVTKPVTGVALDKSTLELSAGGANGTLTATIAPADATNKNVTWRTSDADVATVNNGTVTPVKPGTATITAETEDGNITAACAVTVKPTVTIDTENIKVAQGGTSQFQFTAIPAENILTGTRISIAVSKGENTSPIGDIPETTWVGNTVTLTAKPDAPTGIYHLTITAEMKGQEGFATTTFEVTGSETAAVQSVTLKHNNADIPVGGIELAAGSTTTLAATANPSNASQGVTWSVETGGESVVSVDQNGKITAKAAGTATVVATSTADTTKFAKCIVKVKPDSSQQPQLILSSEKLELVWGSGSHPLTATVTPAAEGQKITWKVTTRTPAGGKEDAVIIVDPEETSSGEQALVMMFSNTDAGTATITATAGDLSATCEVTVKPSLTIKTENISFEQGQQNGAISYSVGPQAYERRPEREFSITKVGGGAVEESKMPQIGDDVSGGGVGVNIHVPDDAPVGTYEFTIKATRNGLETTASTTFEVTAKGNTVQSVAIDGDAEHEIAPARQAVQQQPTPPRAFSFIPQREIQSKPAAPAVTVEPEKVQEPEKEPERVQEPVKEPMKEPEKVQEPEKEPEKAEEPEQKPEPEQKQGIALTCADSFKAGETLTLSGTMNGVSSAMRKIDWSIRDAGATGAAIRDGVMSAEQAGKVTIAATVQNSTTTENFTITVLPGEPKNDAPETQEPEQTPAEPQEPATDGQPDTPAEPNALAEPNAPVEPVEPVAPDGQTPVVTPPDVQVGTVTLPNGQIITNAKKYQRDMGTAVALSGLDALPANAAADSVAWKVESFGTTGAALQALDNTLVNVNTKGVILLSRTVRVTDANGNAAIVTTYYEITIV